MTWPNHNKPGSIRVGGGVGDFLYLPSPKYLAELRGPQPENAYGESERLGLVFAMSGLMRTLP